VIKITDDELLEIIDEMTTALGEILLRHEQLEEATLYDKGISQSKERIAKKRLEIDKLNQKVLFMKKAIDRRKELKNRNK
jgi:hypothetical protein